MRPLCERVGTLNVWVSINTPINQPTTLTDDLNSADMFNQFRLSHTRRNIVHSFQWHMNACLVNGDTTYPHHTSSYVSIRHHTSSYGSSTRTRVLFNESEWISSSLLLIRNVSSTTSDTVHDSLKRCVLWYHTWLLWFFIDQSLSWGNNRDLITVGPLTTVTD